MCHYDIALNITIEMVSPSIASRMDFGGKILLIVEVLLNRLSGLSRAQLYLLCDGDHHNLLLNRH